MLRRTPHRSADAEKLQRLRARSSFSSCGYRYPWRQSHFGQLRERNFHRAIPPKTNAEKTADRQAFDSWKSAVAEDGSGFGGELMRYLSISHRNNCAGGCALAALAPEMGRQSEATRTEIEKGLNQIFQMLNERLPVRRLQPCRTEAIAIYSLMIGALQLSRAVSSTEMSEEILRSGGEAALVLVNRGIMESESFKSC